MDYSRTCRSSHVDRVCQRCRSWLEDVDTSWLDEEEYQEYRETTKVIVRPSQTNTLGAFLNITNTNQSLKTM